MAEAEELHGHLELLNDDDSDHIHFDDDHEGKKVKRTPKLNNDHHHRCNLKYYNADNHDEILHDSSDSDDDNDNFIQFNDDHHEVKIKKKRVHIDESIASLSEDDGDHKHIPFDDDHEGKPVKRTPRLNHDHHHQCSLKYYTADNHDEVLDDESSEDDDNHNFIHFDDDHIRVKV